MSIFAILSAAAPLMSMINNWTTKKGNESWSQTDDTSGRIEQQLRDFAPDYLTAAREATLRAGQQGIVDNTLRSTAPGTTGARDWQITSAKNSMYADISKKFEELSAAQNAQVLGQNAGKSIGRSESQGFDHAKNPIGDIAGMALKGLMNYLDEPGKRDFYTPNETEALKDSALANIRVDQNNFVNKLLDADMMKIAEELSPPPRVEVPEYTIPRNLSSLWTPEWLRFIQPSKPKKPFNMFGGNS